MAAPTLKLVQDVVTRWSSTFMMLDRYMKLLPHVEAALSRTGHADKILSVDENDILEGVVAVLQPLADVSKLLEGDKYSTLSLIWPTMTKLIRFLVGCTTDHQGLPDWSTYPPLVNKFRERLVEEMGKVGRFGDIPNAQKLATMLDPRYKDLVFIDSASCDQYYAILRQAIEEEAAVEAGSPPALAPPASHSRKRCWRFGDIDLADGSRKRVRPIDAELASYRAAIVPDPESDPFAWWRTNALSYPRLAKMAKRYLAIPASSAPSERVFSKMNCVISRRRARLTVKRSEKLIFLSMNMSHLQGKVSLH